ncbi:MAG: hypothetical protein RL404_2674 [Pseudomonadota bacterium]
MKTIELRKALVIESDPGTQAAIRFALQELHQVHLRICSSGREGLQAATDFRADLLLLDVMMPEIDGPTVLAGLRQNALHSETPAIFLTSLVAPEDLRYDEALGVAGVIAKPIDPHTLGDRIVDLLTIYEGMPADTPWLSNELEVLDRLFSRELPMHLSRIRDVLDHCRTEPVTRARCAQLWEKIEDLRNSASAYGNHKISNAARRAEHRVAGLVLNPDRSTRDLREIERELMSWVR